MAPRKKVNEMVIRKTANLTDKMRKERTVEEFEEVKTAQSKSYESDTSSAESLRQKRTAPSAIRTVQIQKEIVLPYDGNLVSVYEKSSNTRSLDTISEPGDLEEFKKKAEESKYVGPQIVPMKFVTTDVETPVKAIFVSDFDFCQAMHHPPQSSTQSKKVEFSKRFEVEQKFLEEMVADIEKLIVSSGRMDVELKVVKAREENDSPRAKISLVRKIHAEKVDDNLNNQAGLVGFILPDLEMKDHGIPLKITKNQQVPSGQKMFESFKRLFGY
ncbi:Gag protease polyprotein [Caenorhabditis elegans]|uniref:Gag protease polyprotein n=1 Tax=Caenorhabditis elegans TaxID=6239 RepID=Q9XWH4_CAEEL|nr:Gag protease polyprotein [Caenorhabditis elegans]CAA21694.2 Gag protease polyprotein [Caenorhabditis elegans]|eukprot:NP_496630.2 Uncharacterized protein CELE_Y57A10B.7 [Caenorhabditis elegans]